MHNHIIRSGLAVLLGLLGSSTFAQALPEGMVFLIKGRDCPEGTAVYSEARGRMMLVSYDSSDWGKTIGDAFTSTVEPTHTHEAVVEINLQHKAIGGAKGGANKRGAKKGKHNATLDTRASQTDLPFVFLQACVVNTQ